MAFDELLASRVRELLADTSSVTEKRMFGGLAFLVGGRMTVVVSREGGLLLPCDPGALPKLLERKGARVAVMRGRPMNGWVRVDAAALNTTRALKSWVERALVFVATKE